MGKYYNTTSFPTATLQKEMLKSSILFFFMKGGKVMSASLTNIGLMYHVFININGISNLNKSLQSQI